MNKNTILPIGATALSSILLLSGFGMSSAQAVTRSTSSIITKVPSTLNNIASSSRYVLEIKS